jgi:hypothetical protein
MKLEPKVKIEKGILKMHDRFDVDTKKVGELLSAGDLRRREVNRFTLWFDAFYPDSKDPDAGIVGGYYTPPEDGIHIIAGEVDKMAYWPYPEAGFEHIILHELGHFFHYRREGVRAFFNIPRAERIAEDYYDRHKQAVGKLVEFAFKPEFVDCNGVTNLVDTWFDLEVPREFELVTRPRLV